MDIRLLLCCLAHDITFIYTVHENKYTINLLLQQNTYVKILAAMKVTNRAYADIALLAQNDPSIILLKIGTPNAELPVYERRNKMLLDSHLDGFCKAAATAVSYLEEKETGQNC